MSESRWVPSERLRRLAERKGIQLDTPASVIDRVGSAETLYDALKALVGTEPLLTPRFMHPLLRAVYYGYCEPKTIDDFKAELRKPDDQCSLYRILQVGPETIRRLRKALL